MSLEEEMKRRGRKEEELSLDRLMCEAEAGTNVAQLLNDIKHEAVDDDLQNLDPGFLQASLDNNLCDQKNINRNILVEITESCNLKISGDEFA